MNDADIIKALEEELKTALIINHRFEESNDTENPEDHKFIALLFDTINLINRQKAEIEQWKEEANRYQTMWRESETEPIKEIPKKPIKIDKYSYGCPCCNKDLGLEEEDIYVYDMIPPKHCSNCGQKLDWE